MRFHWSSVKKASFQCRLVFACIVLLSSLVSHVYVKQLTENQHMGNVSAGAHHSVVLNGFGTIPSSVAFFTKPSIHVLRRNRLRLNDVTLSMVLSPGDLTWSVGLMSVFYVAQLTDLGCQTRYRTSTSLKMFSNMLIRHAGN